jgi:hypothetical protein
MRGAEPARVRPLVLRRLLALLAGVAALLTPATALGPRPRLFAAALFPDVRDLASPTIGHSAHFPSELDASRRAAIHIPARVRLLHGKAAPVAVVGPRVVLPRGGRSRSPAE